MAPDGLIVLPPAAVIAARLGKECSWHDSDMDGIRRSLSGLAGKTLSYRGVVVGVELAVLEFAAGKPPGFVRFVRCEVKHYYRAVVLDDGDYAGVCAMHDHLCAGDGEKGGPHGA